MKYNPFTDKDALIDYGIRGRDIVIPTTPRTPRTRNPSPPPPPFVVTSGGVYVLMPQSATYAKGVHALQEACGAERNPLHPKYRSSAGEVYRPLTFKEDIKARLEDFNRLKNPDGSDRTLDDRLILFSIWNDSCTGVAYKAHSTQFRIIPICEPLILIDKDSTAKFLAVSYASLTGVELDSSRGIYNNLLTKQQIEDHEAWRLAVEGDVALLRNYRDTVFEAIQQRRTDKQMPEKAMGFRVRQNTDEDELRALFVCNLNLSSDAGGSDDLDGGGSFVRVAPS